MSQDLALSSFITQCPRVNVVSPEGKTPRLLEVEAQVTGDIGDADFRKSLMKMIIESYQK